MTVTTWSPPDAPNPSDILQSAVADTRDGSYEQALVKFLWFHDNALQYEKGLAGVRVSFALAYWLELAAAYPPALDAFKRIRDRTEIAFQHNSSSLELFCDLASMNDRLDDESRTAELFAQVAKADHESAKKLYHVAEEYLIAASDFHACGPFLDPPKRIELATDRYRMMKRLEESRVQSKIPIPRTSRTHFIRNVGTLVGLLVLNDRSEEATTAYRRALNVIDDDEFRSVMDAAMTGHLPERHSR